MKKRVIGLLAVPVVASLLAGCGSSGSSGTATSTSTTASATATHSTAVSASVSCVGVSCTMSIKNFTPYATIVITMTKMPSGVKASDVVGSMSTVKDDAQHSYTGAIYSLDNTGNGPLGGVILLWASAPGEYQATVQQLNGSSTTVSFSSQGS